MHARAEELIRELRLVEHPEGGHFSEVFRSPRLVRAAQPGDATGRSALTTIYFLLVAGEVSRWHRLDADEIWHFYEGSSLDLFILLAAEGGLTRVRLGRAASGTAPVHVVPAGTWVAARPSGDFALGGTWIRCGGVHAAQGRPGNGGGVPPPVPRGGGVAVGACPARG
jgi:predicted cupin superfamily sugar epimerase